MKCLSRAGVACCAASLLIVKPLIAEMQMNNDIHHNNNGAQTALGAQLSWCLRVFLCMWLNGRTERLASF